MCQGLEALGHRCFIGAKRRSALEGLARAHGFLAGVFSGGALGYLSAVFLVRRLARELGVDLIVAHGRSHFSRFLAGARLSKVPIVATVHGWDKHPARYAAADCVIAVSEAVGERLARGGVPEEKVAVVRNGIIAEELELFDRAESRRALGLPEEAFVLAFVGRLEEEKGPQVAVEAFARVARELPQALLAFAGAGALKSELQQRARASELAGRVRFLGQRDDVARVYRAADVVLMPSLCEPLGRTALEAMACERPVLASDTGGLREVVADGETGLLLPPGDGSALAQAIVALAGDAGRREAMGRAGRERVLREFRHEHTVRKTAEIYEQVARAAHVAREG